MAKTVVYRYVSWREWEFIRENATIQSRSGVTYFAMDPPSRYETASDATNYLAVEGKNFRVGPVPDDEAPDWDVVSPRTVGPTQLSDGTWVNGGGTEAATSFPLRLFGHAMLR